MRPNLGSEEENRTDNVLFRWGAEIKSKGIYGKNQQGWERP